MNYGIGETKTNETTKFFHSGGIQNAPFSSNGKLCDTHFQVDSLEGESCHMA